MSARDSVPNFDGSTDEKSCEEREILQIFYDVEN